MDRLDRAAPIFQLVALTRSEGQDFVRIGESSYFSGLYVDDDGILQLVNSAISHTTLAPGCKCCTHTFNGKVFTRVFEG